MGKSGRSHPEKVLPSISNPLSHGDEEGDEGHEGDESHEGDEGDEGYEGHEGHEEEVRRRSPSCCAGSCGMTKGHLDMQVPRTPCTADGFGQPAFMRGLNT